jgi:hypothetical protein
VAPTVVEPVEDIVVAKYQIRWFSQSLDLKILKKAFTYLFLS